jgi:uncharacterized membrane protein
MRILHPEMRIVSLKDSNGANSSYIWFLALVGVSAFDLYAFWVLLGSSYFPEYYLASADVAGTLEIAWMMTCCAMVVVGLAWLRHHPDQWRRLVLRSLFVTGVSCLVMTKQFLGMPLQCIDPILFSTACGWTLALYLWGPDTLSIAFTSTLQPGGLSRVLNPERLLAMSVVAVAIGLFAYFLTQQIHYYNVLALGYADCGDYARIMYNTFHNPRELFFQVNPDRRLFFDHFQPGFLPFVPLWLLWPSTNLTSLFQVLAVLGCALPIYWIGKQLFRDQMAALLLAVVWLAYPSVSQFIYSGSYGFHCGSLCLPMYFLALAFWFRERRGWALLFAVWAVLIKEEAAIPIGMFGLYLAIFEKRYRLGMVIAGISFAYFLAMTSVVIPMFNHNPYPAQEHFAQLGATKKEILLSPWMKPRVFWGNLLGSSSFYFAALLVGPLLFIPFRKPSVLLVGLLDCLHPTLKSICYWYQAALLPIVFWAFAAGLHSFVPVRRRAVLSGAIVAAVMFSLFFGNVFWSKTTLAALPQSTERLELVQRIGQGIDPRGSLFATQRIAAHFITQKYLYLDPPVPPQIDYVLLDMHNSWQLNGISELRKLRTFQRQAESIPNLHLVAAEDGIVLYSRKGKPLDAQRLVERDALPPETILQPVDLGRGLSIVGYVTEIMLSDKPGHHTQMHVTTFSSVQIPVTTDLAVRCVLYTNTANAYARAFGSDFQLLGQCIWPVKYWVPGKFYEDDFLIDLPTGWAPDGYSLRFEKLSVAL